MKIFTILLLLPLIILTIACGNSAGGDTTKIKRQALTPEDNIRNLIIDELGTCNREGIRKVSGIGIENTEAGYNISIEFAIDDNLTESMLKLGAKMDVKDVMEKLYTSGYDIFYVHMFGTFSMIDKYGNVEESQVLRAGLLDETAQKISWQNITADMLFDILDYNYLHPAFQ